LQKKEIRSKYEEEGEDLKGPDQQSVLYVSPTEIPQPTFNRETNELIQQQIKEVFLSDFYDPVDNYFQSMSSKYVKAFGSEEDFPYQLFKPLYYVIWLPLLFGSRSWKLLVNHLLTWLHWKHEFT
jgi:hypothetical protein